MSAGDPILSIKDLRVYFPVRGQGFGAARSLKAHLEKLVAEGAARADAGRYALVQ